MHIFTNIANICKNYVIYTSGQTLYKLFHLILRTLLGGRALLILMLQKKQQNLREIKQLVHGYMVDHLFMWDLHPKS